MIRRIILLLIVLALSLSAPALADDPGSGIIEGRIVNGTAGGSSVADQDVTLKTYLNDAEVGSATTKTDAEGWFVFDGLSTESGYIYEVTLTFQEAEYYGEWLSFDEGETTKSFEVTVYDSTTSDEAIKIATAHTVVYVEQDSLHVEEYYIFVNEADRTYIGSGEITTAGTRRTLRLPLPDKMTDLQYGGELMECCVIPDEEGFFDTMPVLPGAKNITYYYQVSYSSGEYMYSQRVNYPISEFNLLVQSESVEVASDWLVRGETQEDSQGNWYQYLSGGDFAPGDILVAQLSGLPETSNQGSLTWVALTLVVLVLGSSFTYLSRRKRLQPVSPEGSLEQRRQRLLSELAELDNDFEDGKIAEEIYRRLRTARKAQLVELMQRSKEESGNT